MGLLAIIAIVILVASIYKIQDLNDKSDLQKEFEKIPIFSSNGQCSFGYRSKDRMMGTESSGGCAYVPIYDFNTTLEKYDSYLKSSGWNLYNRVDSGSGFYYKKPCYILSLGIRSRIRGITTNDSPGTSFHFLYPNDQTISVSIEKDYSC